MTSAAEMALNNQHSVDFYLDQLNDQLQAKRHYLLKLESDWDAVRKPLEERKRSLDAQEMLQKMRECQQEEQVILSETIKREEEQSKLSADLEKQPKLSSRKSYTQRIKEITKNSRISEKILATDRIRREVAESEMKLAAMASKSLDVGKLQADLDVIIRENEYLEQQFQDK